MSGDYISRKALQNRVDEIIKTNHLRPDYVWFTPNGVKTLAKEAPTADVVEVVRCRECKHHDGIRCFCWNSVIVTRFDDYCSNGERKDGEQDEAPTGPYDLLYEEGGANNAF